MTEPQSAVRVRPDDRPVLARAGRDLLHLVGGLPLAILAFVVAVAGFSAGVGTLVVWVGLPILVLTLGACRGLADIERGAVRSVTGRELPHYYRPTDERRGVSRLLAATADPQRWRDLLHAVLGFPVRLFTFVVGVTWTAGGLAEITSVLWNWSIPRGDYNGLVELVTGIDSPLLEITLNTVVGVLMVAATPMVLHGLVALRAGFARLLLANPDAAESAALRARATQLEGSRRAAVQAEAQTLRRVERDIHDGPQQRLVRLNMDLEAVARRLDDDPERARPLLAEALTQSREALDELRALSRGIAPPILTDRGLAAALAAAAARCPVPVELDVRLTDRERLAPAVENTAYFVVTEALTNVAKHSGAGHCTVQVSADGKLLTVQVRDDGRGGAHLGKGHGLAGLADRLATVEGELDVVSPMGGPTVLTAQLPLAGLG